MIFIALGTQKFQFNRLLKLVDKLVEEKKINDKVFAQIGYSDYKPRNYRFVEFLNKDDFEDNINMCNLLITHGGVGTIISGLNKDKSIIVVPRLAKYYEHVDDHQCEIAKAFSRKKLVLAYNEKEELDYLIKQSKIFKYEKYISNRKNINLRVIEFIEKYKE